MSINLKNNEVGIFAVGGLGEVGKNMYGVQYQDEMIIMDCGVSFPNDDQLGIDYVINDYSYVLQNRDKLKAIVITHGHQDHIGGIPYFLKECNVPIYLDALAKRYVENSLEEHGMLKDAKLIEYNENSKFNFGKLSVSFFRVAHSIPEAQAIVVHTPEGNIVFTGDYKFDFTPAGKPANLQRIAQVGSEGVLVLMADSTNAEYPGHTMSEAIVGKAINDHIQSIDGRIIVATFASNVSRVQQVIEAAIRADRKVAVFGRSMVTALEVGNELGYIDEKGKNVVIDSNEIDKYPPEKLILLCTGSQGEPMAALSRIANGSHYQIKLQPGDTILFSSSPIPGNTQAINNVVNKLIDAGANVVAGSDKKLHTSGHGNQGDMLLMMSLLKPKFIMPVHGEYRMQAIQAELGQKVGIPKENTFICENGDMLAVTANSARMAGKFKAGDVYVDGSGIGDVGNIVLNDRHTLSEHGLVVITSTVDYEAKRLVSGPEVMSRGFIYMRESSEFIKEIQDKARSAINRALNESGKEVRERDIRDEVSKELKSLIYKETQRQPMLMIMTLDVNRGPRQRQTDIKLNEPKPRSKSKSKKKNFKENKRSHKQNQNKDRNRRKSRPADNKKSDQANSQKRKSGSAPKSKQNKRRRYNKNKTKQN